MRARRASRGSTVLAAAVVLGGLLLGGCGNPTQPVADCVSARDEELRAIEGRLSAEGELRNGKMVEGEGAQPTFISAELHLRTDEPHDEGDIATWAISDAGSDGFVAVDVVARDESSWPAAPFDVTEDGAIESRACTNLSRGKTPAQLECERRSTSGDSIPLPGGTDCSDL